MIPAHYRVHGLIVIGKITGCFGIRGFVKVHPATHTVGRFSGIGSCFIGNPGGEAVSVDVAEVEFRPPNVLMRFSTFPDRTSAETLIGKYVMVHEYDAVPPPPGSHFIHEIIGCEVRRPDGEKIGTVEEVYKLPAQDVWAIRTASGVVLFPAVREFIDHVDTAAKQIVIRPPEGLLDEDL